MLGELAQCVRMLAEQDEELNLNSQHHIKSVVGVYAYNSSIRVHLSQPAYPKCQTKVRQGIRWRIVEENTLTVVLHCNIVIHIHAHTHTHTQQKTQTKE